MGGGCGLALEQQARRVDLHPECPRRIAKASVSTVSTIRSM
jgi:hypothetical protein